MLDSTPWIPDSKSWINHFLSVEHEFWIPIISGIPDSLSCIPDSKGQDLPYLPYQHKKIVRKI